jgi:hypothetical protein
MRRVLAGVVMTFVVALAAGVPPALAQAAPPEPGDAPYAHLVNGYFVLVIGRPPTSAELQEWVPRFEQPGTTADDARLITSTNTYKRLFIASIYERYLGRGPAASRVEAWLRFLNGGHGYDLFTSQIVGSSEFFDAQQHAGDDDDLAAAYLAITGEPIPASLLAFYSYGREFVPPGTIQLEMLQSAAGRRAFVEREYEQWLRRPPSAYALYRRARDMLQGERPEQVEAEILGSEEFIDRFPAT